jgi:CheY-like chemotaxis protein
VLLDLTLPGMTGHEVAAELRKDEATAMSLIVAVSGYDEQGVPQGFDHLLVKPVDHDTLRSLLASHVVKIDTSGMTDKSEARSSMRDQSSMAR